MPNPLLATPDATIDALFLRALRKARPERFALRALFKAQELLSLALGQRLGQLRGSDEPLQATLAQLHAGEVLAHLLRQAVDLLGERLDKIPERRRPHYTPVQRFRILELKAMAGLSQDETARLFRVATGTVARWESEANVVSKTVGSTVKPTPPVRRYNDTVHHLTQTLARLGFGGYAKIAQHLARAGWKIAKTTVARYVKEPPVPRPDSDLPEKPKRAVKARHPHHTWHLDLTQIQGFLAATTFSLATILDSFSRMPLTWQLFDKPPTAPDMAAFVDGAMSSLGKPKYLIVDQGGEFTGDAFREMVDAYRVKLRYCSAENHRANSRLERFWKSLKRLLGLNGLSRPLTRGDAERDIAMALATTPISGPTPASEAPHPPRSTTTWNPRISTRSSLPEGGEGIHRRRFRPGSSSWTATAASRTSARRRSSPPARTMVPN